ncbi:terminase small subunit [Chitinophaga parva]|uniref:Terminase small subunit n=1 Tax=Chitinophaga parva TaxID=2169414 RepID=A0A2T7BFH2_9BACT|nr:terminase small subunit [Chitinophaga parva]PUZ25032.1 terminase small subunit [Chitinophaga parva]
MALNEKQKRFCEEYLVDLNATKAAIRAGYSQATAYSQGHDLLKKPEVQAYLAEKRKELQERTGITVERVLREYARIAFFDPSSLYTVDGGLKQVRDLDADTAAVIAGVEVHEDFVSDSPNKEAIGQTKKVKFVDKIRALDSLSRHLGLFNDKMEHTGKDGGPIQTETIIRVVRGKRDSAGAGQPTPPSTETKKRGKKV